MPSVVGDAIRMERADFSDPGGDLIGGSWLRWPNLFPKQFLIDQTVEGRVPLGRGERVRIAAIREGLDGDFLFPIALQQHVAVNIGDYPIDDLAAER